MWNVEFGVPFTITVSAQRARTEDIGHAIEESFRSVMRVNTKVWVKQINDFTLEIQIDKA